MFEFEVSPDNPHHEDDEFFACYLWELNEGNLMQIHSNHYLNEAAARTYLSMTGLVTREINDLFIMNEIHLGEPPEKPNHDLIYSERGYWFYQPKGQHINEVA